ncbi:MAG: 50S ribosomal protein L24 [Verrucomicrobium sp.]|nr:50S ribosomal protein L24 [Verrucomicrobium sp.]
MKSLFKSSRQPKQATFHLKKGDEVVIIAGTQRGKRGKVLKINRNSNRVLVEGVNMIKKAIRPTQENPKGGVNELEGSIHISNLMLASAHTDSRASKAASAAPAAKKATKAKKQD